MTEDTFATVTIQRIGEQIGYGHLMHLASALWRRHLRKEYNEKLAESAFVPTFKKFVVEDWQENIEKSNKLYDEIVKAALEE